ncbi:MAG: hypothetical protein ACO2O2_09010 [Acidilobaceae archaeon]|jgi:hypothetical protein
MRFIYIPITVFLLVFVLLSIIQYMDFERGSLETFGYREWRLNGLVKFYDKSLRPLYAVDRGVSLIVKNTTLSVRVEEGGYTLISSGDVEVLKARFSGRDVEWFNWFKGEYVPVGFSPFLIVWPVKPKPILMHLLLKQVDIVYLGSEQDVDFDWIIRGEYLLHLPDGRVIPVRRFDVLELRTPLMYISVDIKTNATSITSEEPFSWFFVEYKGSLPISVDAVVPLEFINKEYLLELGISDDLLERVGYVVFMMGAEEGGKLRVVGGFGLLYFLYPVIGGIISGVLVVVYRWALRRFLKRT